LNQLNNFQNDDEEDEGVTLIFLSNGGSTVEKCLFSQDIRLLKIKISLAVLQWGNMTVCNANESQIFFNPFYIFGSKTGELKQTCAIRINQCRVTYWEPSIGEPEDHEKICVKIGSTVVWKNYQESVPTTKTKREIIFWPKDVIPSMKSATSMCLYTCMMYPEFEHEKNINKLIEVPVPFTVFDSCSSKLRTIKHVSLNSGPEFEFDENEKTAKLLCKISKENEKTDEQCRHGLEVLENIIRSSYKPLQNKPCDATSSAQNL
jgi:hypothetical protein